jgi:hypothetical protein
MMAMITSATESQNVHADGVCNGIAISSPQLGPLLLAFGAIARLLPSLFC